MVERLQIAIVGAGVAGLAAAALLTRLGHRVCVYERFETSRPVGSGLLLQPTGLAALERLGLRGEIEALGHRIERLDGRTTAGRVVFNLAFADLSDDLHALAVHRGALHGVLWRGFERSGAALEADTTVETVEARDGERPVLRDRRGRALPAADLVIDASGASSPLRAALSARPPKPFAYGAVWATVADIGLGAGALTQRFERARVMIGYLPLGRLAASGPPLAAFFWSLKPADHDRWRAGFEAWRREVPRLWPEVAPVVEGFQGPDALTLAAYQHFDVAPVGGRLALLGDAAHCTSPQLGQGANQGLIDAVVLADALAREAELPAALALYARARRRHVRFYQWASRLMTPFFQSDRALLGLARDLTFERMRRLPYLRREMVRTLAGLKTGVFTSAAPARIVNALAGGAK